MRWHAPFVKSVKVNINEALNEGFLEKVTLQLDKDGDRAYEVGGSTLENKYDYYQGDVILEDDISQAKLKELGIKPGDKFVVGVNDDEDNTVTILSKVNESLTEEIWHNRGDGDCQIIERSASGRNALLKRLADGALQPYVIALNMGKDSWGQGKYYTELEDARRDWKRYKFD